MEFHNRFDGPNYGTINQAGRDVFAPNAASSSLEALVAATQLRAALDGLALSPEAAREARQDLDGVERELRRPEPDRGEIARGLTRATETLKTAGALAAAGAALVGPIGVLAGFLGPLGEGRREARAIERATRRRRVLLTHLQFLAALALSAREKVLEATVEGSGAVASTRTASRHSCKVCRPSISGS